MKITKNSKPRGQTILISGPPASEFEKSIPASTLIRLILRLTLLKIRSKVKKLDIEYSFLLMNADGKQFNWENNFFLLPLNSYIRPLF
jgi:alcohol dehydrogenase